MKNKNGAYKSVVTADKLQGDKYMLISNFSDLVDLLNYTAIPEKYGKDISAAIVWIEDGEYVQIWFSEENRYYDLHAWYHPLPFYRPKNWSKKNLPFYWLESSYTWYRGKMRRY